MANMQSMKPFLDIEIVEPGVTITEEGKQGKSMVLLLDGTVTWSRKGVVTISAHAPRYFDDAIIKVPVSRRWGADWAEDRALRDTFLKGLDTASAAWTCIREAGEQRRNMQENLQARLRNMKTFRKFRSEILALLCDNLHIRTFLPNQNIFCQGDPAECVYIVLKGKAEAHAGGKANLLEEGATFGEMVLFGQSTRSITVTALTLCVCNAVYRDFISYAFTLYPDDHWSHQNGNAVASMGSHRIRATEEKDSRRERRAAARAKARSHSKSLESSGIGHGLRFSSAELDEFVRQRQISVISKVSEGSTSASSLSSLASVEGNNLDMGSVTCGGLVIDVNGSPCLDSEQQSPVESVSNLGNCTGNEGRPPLWERFQHRSLLFDVPTPKIPSIEANMYSAPLAAEDNLAVAFLQVLPPAAAKRNAHMHGVRSNRSESTSSSVSKFSSQISQPSTTDGCGSEVGGKLVRVWPTYTSPLTMSVRPVFDQGLPPVARPREVEQSLAIAGHLQALASSLLRINSKPRSADCLVHPPTCALPSSPRGADRPLPGRQKATEHDRSPESSRGSDGPPRLRRSVRVAALRRRYMSPPMVLVPTPPSSARPLHRGRRPPDIAAGASGAPMAAAQQSSDPAAGTREARDGASGSDGGYGVVELATAGDDDAGDRCGCSSRGSGGIGIIATSPPRSLAIETGGATAAEPMAFAMFGAPMKALAPVATVAAVMGGDLVQGAAGLTSPIPSARAGVVFPPLPQTSDSAAAALTGRSTTGSLGSVGKASKWQSLEEKEHAAAAVAEMLMTSVASEEGSIQDFTPAGLDQETAVTPLTSPARLPRLTSSGLGMASGDGCGGATGGEADLRAPLPSWSAVAWRASATMAAAVVSAAAIAVVAAPSAAPKAELVAAARGNSPEGGEEDGEITVLEKNMSQRSAKTLLQTRLLLDEGIDA
eukprot:CAMPEP_0115177152 /NCGR_PEP_ID=MMETSP0270-20121206/5236_1 /TAXON_ID=71861 /ORGANISM="Scrippsiella trochoidea, Strain CCMP3099" /LENGTH=938 /DNA_ID=CAMNT_0002590071 /DNA_START=103 /DNA_END=2917 /DNA_ORIENTATION=+